MRACRHVLLLLAHLALGSVAAADRPPRPLPGNLKAEFPKEAEKAGVDGEVTYRVTVAPDGRVSDVKIRDVPEWGLGFENAARAALSTWRFEPATIDGVPTIHEYEGHLDFIRKRSRSHGRMYAMSSDVAWKTVKKMLGNLRFEQKVYSAKGGIIVTYFKRFSESRFPGLRVPEQIAGAAPRQAEIHVFVPRNTEPARLYVNSRVILGRDGKKLGYNLGFVEDWLFDLFENHTGKTGHALPYNPHYRKRLVAQVLERDEPNDCPSRPILFAGTFDVGVPEVIPASEVRPDWPADDRYEGGDLNFEVTIYEDGSVSDIDAVETTGHRSLAIAAAHAISFWRYKPAMANGCPMAVRTKVRVLYKGHSP